MLKLLHGGKEVCVCIDSSKNLARLRADFRKESMRSLSQCPESMLSRQTVFATPVRNANAPVPSQTCFKPLSQGEL